MDVKNILISSFLIIILFFGMTAVYSFYKTSSLISSVEEISKIGGGEGLDISEITLEQKMGVTGGQFYLGIAMASFTSVGNNFEEAMDGVKSLVTLASAFAASDPELMAQINTLIEFIDSIAPSVIVFYLAALLSGLVAGFLLFKEGEFKEKVINGLASLVIPLLLIVGVMFGISSFINKEIEKLDLANGIGGLPLSIPNFTLEILDYLLIFVVMGIVLAIGLIAGIFINKKLSAKKQVIPAVPVQVKPVEKPSQQLVQQN